MMFGYDTRLSMTDEEEDADNEEEPEVDEDAEVAGIDEKIDLNEKLLLDLHETENDLLSNKILGVEERILDLLDRREEVRRKKGENVNGGT